MTSIFRIVLSRRGRGAEKLLKNQTNETAKKSRIRSKDSFGRTALHFACDAGVVEMVKLLVSNGANLYDADWTDVLPFTALHETVRWK